MANIKRRIIKKHLYLAIFLLSFLSFTLCHHVAEIYTHTEGDTMANAAIVDSGNSFFPFGFYDVSWNTTAEQRLKDLDDIAAAGFNTIHASIKGPSDFNDYGNFLDEAKRLGVHVISEVGGDLLTAVNQFKDKLSVLGWNVADDGGTSHSGSCDQISQSAQKVKAADPNHLTYMSVSLVSQYKNFNHCSDIIGAQDYPIPTEATNAPLQEPGYVMNIARSEAAKFNRTVYANLQTFAWQGSRPPTFDEVRNMTYQALINGVNGVVYYTYHDSTWDLPNHPDLWNGMKSLASEIQQLSPMLLNGNLTKIDTNIADVFAGIWKFKNKAVVVVINTSNTTKNVSITLPLDNSVVNSSSMFSGRPSGMIINGKKLSGSINPVEVHAYQVE